MTKSTKSLKARKLTEKESFKVVIMPGQTELNPKMSRRKRTNSIDSDMCDNEQTLEEKLKDSVLEEEKSAKVESTSEDMLEFFKNGSVSNDVYKHMLQCENGEDIDAMVCDLKTEHVALLIRGLVKRIPKATPDKYSIFTKWLRLILMFHRSYVSANSEVSGLLDQLNPHRAAATEMAHQWRMMEGKLDAVLTQVINKQKFEEGGDEEELFADEEDDDSDESMDADKMQDSDSDSDYMDTTMESKVDNMDL